MLTKKQKRKNLRSERKNAKIMFDEITISNDCLVIILSYVANSACIENIQYISLVNKQWGNIISTNCKILKEVRLICEYGSVIYKGYINHNEHPVDVFSEYKKSINCWSRLILYPKNENHLNIYEITYKGEKGIWDYEKRF